MGSLYVRQDFGVSGVRKATLDGNVATIVGESVIGFSGDGSPARDARVGFIADISIGRNDDLYMVDRTDRRVRVVLKASDCPSPPRPVLARDALGFVHGASFLTALAPGTIFTAFGRHLGPIPAALAQLEGNPFPTSVGGVRVWIDGIPAHLIFTSPNQLSGIIPFETSVNLPVNEDRSLTRGDPVELLVENNGLISEPIQVRILESAPALFSLDSTGTGQGGIFNQDGTLNEVFNPAPAGTIIVMFGSGAGQIDPPGRDGQLATAPFSSPVLPVEVKIGPEAADILYFGDAPGLVEGVFQINARVPETLMRVGAQPVSVRIGSNEAANVFVVVGQ